MTVAVVTDSTPYLPPHLVETPRIVNLTVPQQDWSLLGELSVPER